MCGYRTSSFANPSVHSVGAASVSASAKGSYIPDVELALETRHRVGKYRLSALTELVEPRSRAMQQGSSSAGLVSTTAVAEPGSGAGIGRDWSSASEPAAQAVRIDTPAAAMTPKMTSTFLRLIPFIVASFLFTHRGGVS